MDSLELNKIIAGVLGAVLTLLLFSWVGDLVYGLGEGGHDEAHLAYEIALPEGDAEVAEVEEGPSIGELLVTASAENGEGLFRACAACHTATEEANKVGPYLLNVIGRDIAAVDGFAYSDALLTIDGVWTAENFSHFIENPRGWAPGTKMGYNGMSRAGDRADIIAYLVEASGQTLEDFIVLPEEEPATEDTAVEDAATEDATAVEEAPTEEAPVEEESGEAVEDTADSTTDSLVEPAEQMIEGVDAIGGEAAVEGDATVEGEEATEATETDQTNDAEVTSVPTVVEEQSDSAEVETAPVEEAEPVEEAAPAEEAAPVEEVAPAEEETAPAVDAIEEEEAAAPADPAPANETASDETASGETAPVESGAADMPAFMANASAEDGERAFRACRACHVVEEGVNRVGPSLYGVIDRDIGSVEDFNYSSAMAEKDGAWTYENLDAYLTAPRTWLPGTKMAYAGMRRDQDRANVIAYLEAASQ